MSGLGLFQSCAQSEGKVLCAPEITKWRYHEITKSRNHAYNVWGGRGDFCALGSTALPPLLARLGLIPLYCFQKSVALLSNIRRHAVSHSTVMYSDVQCGVDDDAPSKCR
eukprot:77753-Ditylum_brightwellii.AAC.1